MDIRVVALALEHDVGHGRRVLDLDLALDELDRGGGDLGHPALARLDDGVAGTALELLVDHGGEPPGDPGAHAVREREDDHGDLALPRVGSDHAPDELAAVAQSRLVGCPARLGACAQRAGPGLAILTTTKRLLAAGHGLILRWSAPPL
ncbi:MAG: hypothetical protein CMB99_01185 [Flavobacteriaceae bacterium]|nr:hypothetical protein [Flavobacteriaceae bacterium]